MEKWEQSAEKVFQKLHLKLPLPDTYVKYVFDSLTSPEKYVLKLLDYVNEDWFAEEYKNYVIKYHDAEEALEENGLKRTDLGAEKVFGKLRIDSVKCSEEDHEFWSTLFNATVKFTCMVCKKVDTVKSSKILKICEDCKPQHEREFNKAIAYVKKLRTYHPRMSLYQALGIVLDAYSAWFQEKERRKEKKLNA